MEERYYMDHRHRDRCRKQTSYVGRLELDLIPRDDETQKNWYLPRINMSPTSQSVVVETLKKITTYSSRMCVRNNACEIAKMAYQIQSEEKLASL